MLGVTLRLPAVVRAVQPQNDAMEITERDVEQLLVSWRQLVWVVGHFVQRCAASAPLTPSTPRLLAPPQTFECLRQLTIYGASEDKGTRRCLAALQKAMPWVLIDV